MKHYLIIIIFVVTSCPVLGQSEEWVRHGASSDNIGVSSMAISSTGTLYLSGGYNLEGCLKDENEDYFCFSDSIASVGQSSSTSFLLALNSENGAYKWSLETVGGLIELDNENNIYVLRIFGDTISGDFNNGTYTFISQSYRDGLLLKLDSAGNLLDFHQFEGLDVNESYVFDVKDDKITISGHHWQPIDLNPGEASGKYNDQGFFLFQLDTNLTYDWSYHIDGVFNVRDIVFDSNNDVLVTGEFAGDSINFNTNNGQPFYLSSITSAGDDIYSGFLLKLNESGQYNWSIKTVVSKYEPSGVPMPGIIIQPFSYCIDSDQDYIYNAGVNVGFDGYHLSDDNNTDTTYIQKSSMFLSKYDYQGNHIITVDFKTAEPDTGIVAPFFIKKKQDQLLLSGRFRSPVFFDQNEDTLIDTGRRDGVEGFILSVNSNLEYKWLQIYRALTYNAVPSGLDFYNQYIYGTGNFNGQISINEVMLNEWNGDFLIDDFYVHKFRDPDYKEEVVPDPEFDLNIFPNPTTNYVEIHFGKPVENVSVKITDMRGKKVLEKYFTEATNFIHLDLDQLSSGVYVVKTFIEQNIYTNKLIKQA